MVAEDSVFDFLSEVGVDLTYGRDRAARMNLEKFETLQDWKGEEGKQTEYPGPPPLSFSLSFLFVRTPALCNTTSV
jgi:hypothetical protein